MHKQELINKYTDRLNGVLNLGALEIFNDLINDLKKLDGPEKVTIPQFVADWIEYCKSHNFTLFGCLEPVDIFESLAGEIFEGDIRKCIGWCRRESDKIARAWLDGYEVEKEKKYKVVLLNYNDGHLNLVNVRTLGENIIFFTKKTQFEPRSLELTKAEIISSGFGWVFDCPGVQIEEVK